MDELDDLLDPGVESTIQNNKVLPNANATLVLGILSIVGCFFYGIPGLILGIIAVVLHGKDKKLYRSNPNAYETSYKNAKAGFVCGIIGLSLSAFFFLFFILAFGMMASVLPFVSR